jgi:hypothetical protein
MVNLRKEAPGDILYDMCHREERESPPVVSGKGILVISGLGRIMYQRLVPEPEGAICPKRSKPQANISSPHGTQPVSNTDRIWIYKPVSNTDRIWIYKAGILPGLPLVQTELPVVSPQQLTEPANRSERRNRWQISGSPRKTQAAGA